MAPFNSHQFLTSSSWTQESTGFAFFDLPALHPHRRFERREAGFRRGDDSNLCKLPSPLKAGPPALPDFSLSWDLVLYCVALNGPSPFTRLFLTVVAEASVSRCEAVLCVASLLRAELAGHGAVTESRIWLQAWPRHGILMHLGPGKGTYPNYPGVWVWVRETRKIKTIWHI